MHNVDGFTIYHFGILRNIIHTISLSNINTTPKSFSKESSRPLSSPKNLRRHDLPLLTSCNQSRNRITRKRKWSPCIMSQRLEMCPRIAEEEIVNKQFIIFASVALSHGCNNLNTSSKWRRKHHPHIIQSSSANQNYPLLQLPHNDKVKRYLASRRKLRCCFRVFNIHCILRGTKFANSNLFQKNFKNWRDLS